MRRLAILLACVAAAGCGRSGPPEGLTGPRELDVVAPPVTAGTISVVIDGQPAANCPPACGTIGFTAGAMISLTASGNLGTFGQWLGDAEEVCGVTNPCSFRALENRTIEAGFTARLAVSASDGAFGTVLSNPDGIACPGDCTEDYPFGQAVTLHAVQGPGLLQGWGGDCASPVSLTCDLLLDQDRDVVGWFGRVRVDLYGTPGDEYAEAIAADPLAPSGFVVAGWFTEPLSLGSALLPYSAGEDLFIARFDSALTVTWSETIGGDGDIHPHGLAVADQGGELACYVAGSFLGEAEFDGATPVDPTAEVNAFVSKHVDDLAASPLPVWSQTVAGIDADSDSLFADVAFDGVRLAVAGLQSGQVLFPTALASGNQENRKHSLNAVLDSAGGIKIARHHGKNAAADAEARAVILDAAGNVVSAGFRDDVVDDNANAGGPCASAVNADEDAWLYEVPADFSACPVNLATITAGEDRWSGLSAGPDGNYLVVGFRVDAPVSVIVSERSDDGGVTWTADFPATVDPAPFGAAYDKARDEWVIAGSFEGTLSAGGQDYDSAGGFDIAVIRLDRAGELVSVDTIGGTGDDIVGGPEIANGTGGFFDFRYPFAASAVDVLGDGTTVVAGWTTSPTLGPPPFVLPTAGGADLFVLHLSPP